MTFPCLLSGCFFGLCFLVHGSGRPYSHRLTRKGSLPHPLPHLLAADLGCDCPTHLGVAPCHELGPGTLTAQDLLPFSRPSLVVLSLPALPFPGEPSGRAGDTGGHRERPCAYWVCAGGQRPSSIEYKARSTGTYHQGIITPYTLAKPRVTAQCRALRSRQETHQKARWAQVEGIDGQVCGSEVLDGPKGSCDLSWPKDRSSLKDLTGQRGSRGSTCRCEKNR